MKNRDWLAHAAIFGWNSKNWLVSSSNFSTPQIFVENFWNKNGVHVGVFFLSFFFHYVHLKAEGRTVLALFCYGTQSERNRSASTRPKQKETNKATAPNSRARECFSRGLT